MEKSYAFVNGEKVLLRAIEEKDIDFFCAIRNNPLLQVLLMITPRPQTREQIVEWITKTGHDPQRLMFVIVDRFSEVTVGYLQLTSLNATHGTCELGICVSPEFQGKGFGTEAMELLDRIASDFYKVRKFVLRVVSVNEPAIRLYRKIGFREVGVLRDDFWASREYHDVIVMEKFTALGELMR
jgi:RimJ/RimL family protein N-acetyltransferase